MSHVNVIICYTQVREDSSKEDLEILVSIRQGIQNFFGKQLKNPGVNYAAGYLKVRKVETVTAGNTLF